MESKQSDDDETPTPLAYVFEENIGGDDLCVSFKLNITPVPDTVDTVEHDDYRMCLNIIKYMKEYAEVVAFTQGLHLEGKLTKPHIHLHFVIRSTIDWVKTQSNASNHRNRFFDKNGYTRPEAKSLSVKTAPVDKTSPKYHFLAYPLKEGRYFKDRKNFFSFDDSPMTVEMFKFLRDYAQGIYNLKVAKDLSNSMSEERKEAKYEDLLATARKWDGSGTYKQFVDYIDEAYLRPFIEKGNHCPDIGNLKKNCQRAAYECRFFKLSEL